jgi:hypothetical protein
MPITDFPEFERLILQIERDLVKQTQLRTLLTVADEALSNDPMQLRTVKARLKRATKRSSDDSPRNESKRPILRIERDLLAQEQRRVLLNGASRSIANERQELRTVKTRLKRSRHQMP